MNTIIKAVTIQENKAYQLGAQYHAQYGSVLANLKACVSDLSKHLKEPVNNGFAYLLENKQSSELKQLKELNFDKPFLQLFEDLETLRTNKLFNGSCISNALDELELTMFAIDVHDYVSEDSELYKQLLADPFHRLADHLPHDLNMRFIKGYVLESYWYLMFYFSIVAELEAFKRITGFREWQTISNYANIKKQTVKTSGKSFLDIYSQFAVLSVSHTEDSFLLMSETVKELSKRVGKAVKFPLIPVSKLRPSETTINKIIKNQLFKNELMHKRITYKTEQESALNDFYLEQLNENKVLQKVTKAFVEFKDELDKQRGYS